MRRVSLLASTSLALALLVAPAAVGEEAPRTGAAAYGDWRADAPGVARLITPADLPAPFATTSASGPSRIARRPKGALPRAPQGFGVDMFASGLRAPRVVRVAPNGDVFVADSGAGEVRAFRPDGGDPAIFAADLPDVYGLAFFPAKAPRWLYVATTERVLRFPYRAGDRRATAAPQTIVAGLPSGGHWTRDLAFSPDGATLFVAVGSASNLGAGESERDRADVLAFDPEGRRKRVTASGLRNCSGLTVQPATGALWCVVNERDGLGDNLPPDYATRLREGAFYGWPWFYIGAHPDPRMSGAPAGLAANVVTPDVLIQPHSAPLGIAFYDGEGFPPPFRGDAFVALHGSWNRARRTGYKVVRLLMKDGAPTGAYEDFLTGFVADDRSVWGRPVGVAVSRDGALLVSDDAGGVVWRVRYTGR